MIYERLKRSRKRKGKREVNSGDNNWGNKSTLDDHYTRHGKEVGAKNVKDYTKKANDFYNNRSKYQVKVDKNGVTRVYDAKNNIFGSYNKDGSTRTFYSPKRGQSYFNDQPGKLIK
jgi:pyocin large subunit-like protein